MISISFIYFTCTFLHYFLSRICLIYIFDTNTGQMSKITVNLRQRIKKDGKTAGLYLDIYNGYTKKQDGSLKIIRKKEALDYFIYTNPKSTSERSHNKEINRKAEAIKGQRLKDLLNNKYDFKSETKGKADFIQYFRNLTESRLKSIGNYGSWDSVLKHLINHTGQSLSFENIDVSFCESFKLYLENVKKKSGSNLSQNSVNSYFNKFRAALNQAVEDEIILKNPAKKITLSKAEESIREFLTEEEVVKLSKTECRYEVLKKAFLFSCLTGLRWSDVHNLKWNQLEKDQGKWKVIFHQKKTKGLQYHPIPEHAIKLIGDTESKSKDEKVFQGLRYSSYMNTALSQWVLKAEITKNITFHCARHTFATLLLTKGTDIYTVSKLLGHSEIRTTQIYAKIIDKVKNKAVDNLDIF